MQRLQQATAPPNGLSGDMVATETNEQGGGAAGGGQPAGGGSGESTIVNLQQQINTLYDAARNGRYPNVTINGAFQADAAIQPRSR